MTRGLPVSLCPGDLIVLCSTELEGCGSEISWSAWCLRDLVQCQSEREGVGHQISQWAWCSRDSSASCLLGCWAPTQRESCHPSPREFLSTLMLSWSVSNFLVGPML